MPVNSHIQVPISIIKNFSYIKDVARDKFINKENYIFELNLKNNDITECSCSNYGAKVGYYSDEIEKLLSKKYETPFGVFKKKCYDFIKYNESSILITETDFKNAKNYLKSCFFRSQKSLDEYNEHSSLKDLGPISHSFYVEACDKRNISPIEDFDKYSLTILVTKSKKKFINNYAGLAFLPTNGEYQIFLPISPFVGLLFFKTKEGESIYKDLQIVYDDSITFEINKYIYLTEKYFGKNSLFSNDKKLLEEIKTFIEKGQNEI